MLIMVLEWPVFMLLATYLDRVLDAGTGVREPWDFFMKMGAAKPQHALVTDSRGKDSSKFGAALAESTQETVIQAVGLTKVWPAADGNAAKTAVDGVDLTLHRKECFGLLGQNGAGKSYRYCNRYIVPYQVSPTDIVPYQVRRRRS